MKATKFIVAGVIAALAFNAPVQAKSDDTKKALLAAAAIAGLAALAHNSKHHKSGSHNNDAQWEHDFDRGHRDAMHGARYNNHNQSEAYKEGFESGRVERSNQLNYNQSNHWQTNQHQSPSLARRACIGEASSQWGINPRQVSAMDSSPKGKHQYKVKVTSGYHHATCVASEQGNVSKFKDKSEQHSVSHSTSACPNKWPEGTNECEYYKDGMQMGRQDRRANMSSVYERHAGYYDSRFEKAFKKGYKQGWEHGRDRY